MNPPTIGTHPAHPVDPTHDGWYGLTKREYFAALAMQATDLELYANTFGNKWAEKVADDAVKMADALIEQLNKIQNETNQTVISDINKDTTGANPE